MFLKRIGISLACGVVVTFLIALLDGLISIQMADHDTTDSEHMVGWFLIGIFVTCLTFKLLGKSQEKEESEDVDDDETSDEYEERDPEELGKYWHDEGEHCTGCPDSEVPAEKGVSCQYVEHCPQCPTVATGNKDKEASDFA